MLIAALIGWPLPLLPIQLLWINLVTDGLPALALATDPIDPGVLTRSPRHPGAQLIDWDFSSASSWSAVSRLGLPSAPSRTSGTSITTSNTPVMQRSQPW